MRAPANEKRPSGEGGEGKQASPQSQQGILGRWPRVNRQCIRDYPKGERSSKFQIHLDVPIDNEEVFTKLDAALKAGDSRKALKILKEYLKPGDSERHAWKTTEAALSE